MRLKKLWHDQLGSSMVEMTLVTPFLLVLGLGIVEFSNAFYHHHLITTGLRDAARYLARVDDVTSAAGDAKDIAVTGEIGGAAKRVSWWTTSDVSVNTISVSNPVDPTTGARQYRGGDPIQVVRVSTNVSHPGLGFLSLIGITTPLAINISHEERVIGE